ncbi:hypothetical protein D9M72_511630 [compost metagenome]
MHLPEGIRVFGFPHPVGGCHTEDDGIAGPQPGGHRVVEVVQLRFVDVLAQLAVQPHEPPAGRVIPARQPEREVAARLDGPPAADVPLPGEEPDEGRQAVVPVMVAGKRQQHAVPAGGAATGQRGPVRPHHAVFVGGGRGHRIHLVAAQHQYFAAAQFMPVHQQRLFGQQRRHRVGGIKAVAEVGREIQPQCSGPGPVREAGSLAVGCFGGFVGA